MKRTGLESTAFDYDYEPIRYAPKKRTGTSATNTAGRKKAVQAATKRKTGARTKTVSKVAPKGRPGTASRVAPKAGLKKAEASAHAKKDKKTAVRDLKKMIYLAACFSVFFLIMMRNVMVNDGVEEINRLKGDLSKLEAQNQQTQIKIDRAVDLKNIEFIAATKLRMGRPERDQIIYIDMEMGDLAEPISMVGDEGGIPPTNAMGVFTRAISDVLAYLD